MECIEVDSDFVGGIKYFCPLYLPEDKHIIILILATAVLGSWYMLNECLLNEEAGMIKVKKNFWEIIHSVQKEK